MIGAAASDQSNTAITAIDFPMAISDVIPSYAADSASYPTYIPANGSVHIEAVKSSMLDEDPTFLWTGAGSCGASIQYKTGDSFDTTDTSFAGNNVLIQSVLGATTLTSLGSELAKARQRGKFFYGSLPPFMSKKGNFFPCYPKKASETGVSGLKWGVAGSYVTPSNAGGVEVPICSVLNSSSTNSLKLVITICRNIFVHPSEQYLAAVAPKTVPESPYQLDQTILLRSSIGHAGQTPEEAHLAGVLEVEAHSRVKPNTLLNLTDYTARLTQTTPKGQVSQVSAQDDGIFDDVAKGIARVVSAPITATISSLIPNHNPRLEGANQMLQNYLLGDSPEMIHNANSRMVNTMMGPTGSRPRLTK